MTVGSVSKVAVTLIRGALAVIWCATGFSTVRRPRFAAPGWTTRASVVPTSQLGQF